MAAASVATGEASAAGPAMVRLQDAESQQLQDGLTTTVAGSFLNATTTSPACCRKIPKVPTHPDATAVPVAAAPARVITHPEVLSHQQSCAICGIQETIGQCQFLCMSTQGIFFVLLRLCL